MSRKRSIASLLDDLDEESPLIQSSSVAHSHRNRSIASIVNEETEELSITFAKGHTKRIRFDVVSLG